MKTMQVPEILRKARALKWKITMLEWGINAATVFLVVLYVDSWLSGLGIATLLAVRGHVADMRQRLRDEQ